MLSWLSHSPSDSICSLNTKNLLDVRRRVKNPLSRDITLLATHISLLTERFGRALEKDGHNSQTSHAMGTTTFFISLQTIFIVHQLIPQSCQSEFGNFPVLITKRARARYYLVENIYSDGDNIEVQSVLDDMECMRLCSRMGDSCETVNFKEKGANGQAVCQLITKAKNSEPSPRRSSQAGFLRISLEKAIHKSCAEVYKASAVYKIAPVPSRPLYVYCDMGTSGGGWTVIQKRNDGSVDFYRDWDDYKRGFGDKLGEYWLGLDNINLMTSQAAYKLRVDMEDFKGNTRYAEYNTFKVADESDNYRLTVGQFSGTAGDALRYHSGMEFSTRDRDNDENSHTHCAVKYKGAWWYSNGLYSNLNGQYYWLPQANYTDHGNGIIWLKWKGFRYSLKRIAMKIRPVN